MMDPPMMPESSLITPYGGELVDLLVSDERRAELRARSRDWPSWGLTPRQLCDVELLLSGAFSPLRGFMGREDHERVLSDMRLASGVLWPLPVTLDVSEALAASLEPGGRLALRDPEGLMVAVLEVSDIFRPDRAREAAQTLGTADLEHPGARHLLQEAGPVCVGGRLEGIELPVHYDFRLLRYTPRELRAEFVKRGWRRVLAYQTRNPVHRPHHAITMRAARERQANLLLHPAVGETQPGDVDIFTRVRSYQAVLPRYPKHTVMLSLLQLAMRMAGPREALLHAIVRRNHGCTHFIVGRDQAGPEPRRSGEPFYEPFAAQALALEHADELGIEIVPVGEMVYHRDLDEYDYADAAPAGAATLPVSGSEVRRRLAAGRSIPPWMSFPEVVRELKRTYRPRHQQGFTVLFTGLSGAGKSTLANVLQVRLLEMGGRPVTLLDGDIVRRNLSSELTFSREHRDINIRRIGFVASEITKNGGIAICAPIAPYDRVRREVRRMVSERGGFVLVHVSTPLDVCEARDRKGIYAKARAGLVKEFTGISDPYEEPGDAEIVIDTSEATPDQCTQQVLLYLEKEGFITGARDNGS
jgi:sulfate adenylyltransferase